MRSKGSTLSIIVSLLFIPVRPAESRPAASDNPVLQWNAALLHTVGVQRLAPVFTARALAVLHTCMFDAWAAYDARAQGVHWTMSLRQAEGERTEANKAEAVSFAAHLALTDLFPADTPFFDAFLSGLGYFSPGPAGAIGLTACESVLAMRRADGANQLGDLVPGAYADYTGYAPVNDVAVIIDPNRWQPLASPAGPQQFLAPHWGRVVPFAIDAAALRPPPPPTYPHGRYIKELNQILRLSARLDDRAKVIAEYWADGPGSVTPPGHWSLFAQAISRRDGHSLDDDVLMFFVLGNGMLDASIAVWECKREYDLARPVTAIRFFYGGKPVRSWAGPGRGTALMDGAAFVSYIPTPPFAEYVSGHSTFSAAGAEILRRFTGSDNFGAAVTVPARSSTIEPEITPAVPVTLSWATFSEAADEAAVSRRYGGIHFESGDLEGRALGRKVGAVVWTRALMYLYGTALPEW
jgi:hypothetical protein